MDNKLFIGSTLISSDCLKINTVTTKKCFFFYLKFCKSSLYTQLFFLKRLKHIYIWPKPFIKCKSLLLLLMSFKHLHNFPLIVISERLDETCIMTYEFSGGTHEVPCYNDTYSWIVCYSVFKLFYKIYPKIIRI